MEPHVIALRHPYWILGFPDEENLIDHRTQLQNGQQFITKLFARAQREVERKGTKPRLFIETNPEIVKNEIRQQSTLVRDDGTSVKVVLPDPFITAIQEAKKHGWEVIALDQKINCQG